jgi:hypothetical protein
MQWMDVNYLISLLFSALWKGKPTIFSLPAVQIRIMRYPNLCFFCLVMELIFYFSIFLHLLFYTHLLRPSPLSLSLSTHTLRNRKITVKMKEELSLSLSTHTLINRKITVKMKEGIWDSKELMQVNSRNWLRNISRNI